MDEETRCPVCFEIPEREIFQCRNGHAVCDICSDQLTECPQCRLPFEASKFRNRALERLLDTMKFDCPNILTGCKAKISRREISSHVEDCSFGGGTKFCQLLGHSCGFLMNSGRVREALMHLQKDHDFIIREGTVVDIRLKGFSTFSESKRSKWMWTPVVLNVNNANECGIIFVSIFDEQNQTIALSCFQISKAKSASLPTSSDINVKFTIRSGPQSKVPDIVWITPPLSIKKAHLAMKQPFFRFPMELLNSGYVQNGVIKVRCSVIKIEAVEKTIENQETGTSFYSPSMYLSEDDCY